MSELYGNLVQMNSSMELGDTALLCIILGVVVAVLFMAMTIITLGDGWRCTLVCLMIMAIGIGAVGFGINMPRVKEIKACAIGPVNLEQIAIVYDVVSVDGKQITLRER